MKNSKFKKIKNYWLILIIGLILIIITPILVIIYNESGYEKFFNINELSIDVYRLVNNDKINCQFYVPQLRCKDSVVIYIDFNLNYYAINYYNKVSIYAEVPPGSECSKEKISSMNLFLIDNVIDCKRILDCYWDGTDRLFVILNDTKNIKISDLKKNSIIIARLYNINDSLFTYLIDSFNLFDSCSVINKSNKQNDDISTNFNENYSVLVRDINDFINKFNNCDNEVSNTNLISGLFFKIKNITYQDIKGKTLKLEMVFDNGDTLSCSKLIP